MTHTSGVAGRSWFSVSGVFVEDSRVDREDSDWSLCPESPRDTEPRVSLLSRPPSLDVSVCPEYK